MSASYEIPHGEIPRDDSDLYSYAEKSFNEWQYGDEASLYSIAEDSREDRASEVPSMAGTETASEVPPRTVQVDMRWAGEDPQEAEIDSSSSSTLTNLYYRLQHSTQMKGLVFAFLGIAMLAAVFIGLLVSSMTDGESEGGIADTAPPFAAPVQPSRPVATPTAPEVPISPPTDAPLSPPTTTPTTAPTHQPTLHPTHSTSYKLADGFISSALRSCTDSDLLEDPTTPQGRIYERLVTELHDLTSIATDGFIYYPLHFGIDYVQEKFALEMLYAATNGEDWDVDFDWNTETDPCEGWHGITTCRARREGSCGVLDINLDSNSLSGELPPEICCLPCLESLVLSNNMLLGEIPMCLQRMGASVNLDNNLYSQVDDKSAELQSSP